MLLCLQRPLTWTVTAVLVFAGCDLARAQDTGGPVPTPLKSPQVPVAIVLPQVTDVQPSRQGIAGHIRVTVGGLFPDGPIPDAVALSEPYRQWVLYLDGQPLPGLHPTSVDVHTGEFYFTLRRDETTSDAWRRLFAGVLLRRGVSVSVGPAIGGTPVQAFDPTQFELELIQGTRGILGLIVFVIVAACVVSLGAMTNMLRGPPPPRPSGTVARYSLSRSMIAWWTLVVVGAYLFLGIATANWVSSMSGTALALLGIAAGTGGISRGIDAKKHPKPEDLLSRISGLTQREQALNTAVTRAHVTDAPRLATQLQEVVTERDRAQSTLLAQTGQESTTSGSFWLDVISDASGVAIHRVQAAVWSLILGGMFAMLTVRDLAMPDFDSSLLALAGLSSAAYLGLKLPERTDTQSRAG